MAARQRQQVRTPAHRHVGCNTLQAFVPVPGAEKRAALGPNNASVCVCVCDMYKSCDNGNDTLVLPPVLPRYEALDSPVMLSPTQFCSSTYSMAEIRKLSYLESVHGCLHGP